MNNNLLFFLQCIVLPFMLPSALVGFWLGMRYARHGFPGMFIPGWGRHE
jgi:ABC-type sulfate transport system permease component